MLSLYDFAVAFALITMILAIIGILKDKRRSAMEGYISWGNYYAKLVSLTMAGNDYMGRPTAVLTYKIINYMTEKLDPFVLTVKAFQNGRRLEEAIFTDAPEEYDAESSIKEIPPGNEQTVTVGYVLENDQSPVTVEASGTIAMTDKKLRGQFFLARAKSTFPGEST